ncbi:MAG: endonuclease III domain-containing protein [Alkalispirochaeta sp.]
MRMISSPTTRRSKTTRNKHPRTDDEWEVFFRRVTDAIGADYAASVNRIAGSTPRPDPFRVLIATVISLRTRDEVTFSASGRLFRHAGTPEELLSLTPEQIAELIYPAGFYRNKSKQLHRLARILVETYNGTVPDTIEELTALPGVGRKTANLVLGIGFGIPAICVDIHVHRIPNRLGWIRTTTPGESEEALGAIVPRDFWIPMNEWFVGFGQQICTPQSPRCSMCPFTDSCPRAGVTRSR